MPVIATADPGRDPGSAARTTSRAGTIRSAAPIVALSVTAVVIVVRRARAVVIAEHWARAAVRAASARRPDGA